MCAQILEATLIEPTNQRKKAERPVVLRSAVIEGRARIRVPFRRATASLVLRIRLPHSKPIDIGYDPHAPTHKLDFGGRQVTLQVCTNGKQHLEAGAEARAAQVFEEALFSEFIRLRDSEDIRPQYEKFFSLCFQSVCVPADNAILNDLALVLAEAASENLKVDTLKGRSVPQLVTEARRAFARKRFGFIEREDQEGTERRADYVDYLDALREAESKVLEEVWSPCKAASLGKTPELRSRLQRFRDSFEETFPKIVSQCHHDKEKDDGLPTVRGLVLKHRFAESVFASLFRRIRCRWNDITKADHFRCVGCGKLFEKWRAPEGWTARNNDGLVTLSLGKRIFEAPLIPNGNKLLKHCLVCDAGPPGTAVDLGRLISKEVERSLSKCGASTDLEEKNRLIGRVMYTGLAEIAEALNQLSSRPSAAALREHPDLVVSLKVPQSARPPESISVRVGDACASYLETHDRKSLKAAVRSFVEALNNS